RRRARADHSLGHALSIGIPAAPVGLACPKRSSGQNPLEIFERLTHADSFGAKTQFADRVLMRSATHLDHGNRLSCLSVRLEVTKHENVVGQIVDVDRS